MELLQLKVFLALAGNRDIAETARILELSASSVRKCIRQLEDELGYPLFYGNSPGLKLNENGSIVLKYAENILQLTAELPNRLRDYEDLDNSVHLMISSAAEFLSPELESFSREHPGIKLRIKQLRDSWNEGAFLSDLRAFVSGSEEPEDRTVTLIKDIAYLAVSEKHPLAGASYVDLAALTGESFVLPSVGQDIRGLADQCFSRAGFLPKIAIECDVWHWRSSLIAKDTGVSLVFPSLYPWRTQPGISLIPIRLPLLPIYVRLNWNQPEYLSSAAKKLRDHLLARFNAK